MSKKRSASSSRWLQEHFSDPYVKQARIDGYRSRAVYKLIELQERDKIIKPGMTVVDLGAAPGGWSQILTRYVGRKGRVVALDILPMDAIPNVEFIQGDFSEEGVFNQLLESLGGNKVDWILSDMSPNKSGIESVDQPRAMHLAELALDIAVQVVNKKGGFLTKAFQGEGFDEFLLLVRKNFKQVFIRKPASSRDRSREVYILAKESK